MPLLCVARTRHARPDARGDLRIERSGAGAQAQGDPRASQPDGAQPRTAAALGDCAGALRLGDWRSQRHGFTTAVATAALVAQHDDAAGGGCTRRTTAAVQGCPRGESVLERWLTGRAISTHLAGAVLPEALFDRSVTMGV